MFKVDSNYCSVLKAVQPLVKALNTSISASKKNQTITFSMFNSDNNILFFHQINGQKVDAIQKFAVATDRLVSLVHDRKTDISIDFDGSALNYKYRQSKGRVETHRYDAHERPNIVKDKILTSLARKYFGLLSLKTVVENTEGYLFIDEQKDYTKLIVSDSGGYHAVMITIPVENKTSSLIAIPLSYVQNAIRVLKENINICNDEEHLYCYTRSDEAVSIIRFRNVADTGSITAKVVADAIESNNEFSFKATGELFDDILKDYATSKDPDRGGQIKVCLENKKIKLSTETRHGSAESNPENVKTKIKEKIEFQLPTKVLPDILRLKGEVTMGLKENQNIFFIEQVDSATNMKTTYMCTAQRLENENN